MLDDAGRVPGRDASGRAHRHARRAGLHREPPASGAAHRRGRRRGQRARPVRFLPLPGRGGRSRAPPRRATPADRPERPRRLGRRGIHSEGRNDRRPGAVRGGEGSAWTVTGRGVPESMLRPRWGLLARRRRQAAMSAGAACRDVLVDETLHRIRRGHVHRARAETVDAMAMTARFGKRAQPPVTLMCRETLGLSVRRSMMKSWPLGLREMASWIAASSGASPSEARIGVLRSAASSWPRHM